jgi:hypothetical protein
MKKLLLSMVAVAFVVMLGAGYAFAQDCNSSCYDCRFCEGCTPGYWKNHTENWPAGINPGDTVGSWFSYASSYGLGGDTLLDALSYHGGPGATGAARILLRASVAALLNIMHPGVNTGAPTVLGLQNWVNGVLDWGDRSQMLMMAAYIDENNNTGCPLN